MAKFYNPTTVGPPFGTFSQIGVAGTGRMVYLKGQVSLDRHRDVVGDGDMDRQVEQVLMNIRDFLAAVNGQMGDVISAGQTDQKTV